MIQVLQVYFEGRKRVDCLCFCGKQFNADYFKVKIGHTVSCGCRKRSVRGDESRTHGEGNHHTGKSTTEYNAWCSMKRRCYNPKAYAYDRYGGRGITVCERWLHSYENFLADLGRKPSPRHSLDRIDNDGNYEPDNCRWTTWEVQARNRTKWPKKRRKSGSTLH